jgi:O-antigen/teichoic acid export membrane protein
MNKEWFDTAPDRSGSLARSLKQLMLLSFRGVSTVAKLVLALYTARFLGLADLGVYGLITAAATLTPALLGFGLTDWVARQIVLIERAKAVGYIAARLALSLGTHFVFQPVLWTANWALGSPVPNSLAMFIAPILLLEHLASDAHDLIVARGHVVLVSVLQLIRAGLWPFVVVAIGIAYPETRTLAMILLGWLAGLTLMWLILVAQLWIGERWRSVFATRFSLLLGGIRQSLPLYVRDITGTAGLFLDRYIISILLGLELTGVYTFFWSVANVVHGMIISVVVQPYTPTLIKAAVHTDASRWHVAERNLRVEAVWWTIGLSFAAGAALMLLMPLLQRPTLEAHLAIFWLVLLATWARIAADGYGFVLLALHRNTAILIASICGAVGSIAFNFVLVPLLGLPGAAIAFLFTGITLLVLRYRLSRIDADNEEIQSPSLSAEGPQPTPSWRERRPRSAKVFSLTKSDAQ